jgi:hypothetical protein
MEYFNCRVCDDKYETQTKVDVKSRDELKYCRYLGFCGDKCWDTLTEHDKTAEYIFAYIEGDTRKRAGLKFKPSGE